MARNKHTCIAQQHRPTAHEIAQWCLHFQQVWTSEERRERAGGIYAEAGWTVPQILTHHTESAQWIGGKARRTKVMRRIDGR